MIGEFERQLKRGMLDIIILKRLNDRPAHGYELLLEIKKSSQVFSSLKEGTLYPRLYRLLDEKCIVCTPELSEDGTKIKKVYKITLLGREQLQILLKVWMRFVDDMNQVLR